VPVFPLAVPDSSCPPPFLVQQNLPIPDQTRQTAAVLAFQRRCASNRPKNLHCLSVIHKIVQTEVQMPAEKSKWQEVVHSGCLHIVPVDVYFQVHNLMEVKP